jgi:hypothetical protein
MDVPAGVDLDIIVAPEGAGIENGVGPVTINLVEGETYIAIANGIVSTTGYDPAPGFSLDVFPTAREAATDAGNTDVLAFHGSTDAPIVSVWETGVGAGEIISDFAYGDFAGYLELGTLDYILEVRDATGTVTVAAYAAPLATLELDGAALTVVASGFLSPGDNSDGPAFGLFVALATGGELIPLPLYEAPEIARLQIIHNSPDAATQSVDIFVNGELFESGFEFRTATPFMDVPAGVDLDIIVAAEGAGIENGVGPVTINLVEGETYIAIANGIVSTSGYDPAPGFSLDVFPTAREAATDVGNTDVLAFHGSTDAPIVSVWETGVGAGEIISDFAYGDFAGYLELGTMDYVLEVRDASGEVTVAAYAAPLATLGLEGAALTVVASGFLSPEDNSDGPAFGLFVALATGGALIELPLFVETFAVTFNVDMTYAEGFDPDSDVVYITGSFLEWAQPGSDPENQTMTRIDDSMVYTQTLQIAAGTYAYKYFLNAGWDGGEWPGGDDRVLVVEEDMTVNDWFGYASDPTNVPGIDVAADLYLFPNPARDVLNVVAWREIREVRVVSITGQVVQQFSNILSDRYQFNLGGMREGIYLIQVVTEHGTATKRVQVSR